MKAAIATRKATVTRLSARLARSAPVRALAQAKRLGPGLSFARQTSAAAIAAKPALKRNVEAPIGAECRLPKQWQLGLRPRARLAPRAVAKTASRRNAERAPSHVDEFVMSAAAIASSA